MKFIYYTTDGKRHVKIIDDNERDEILDFIEWLETDKSVVKWF
jgi:hypothetical protein